ncbi:ABC transporter substrate-binding protein [Alsobacter sp. R-9]
MGTTSAFLRSGAVALALLLGVAHAAAEQAPRRVVSANLCTDQLLLALADREQIASLSPFATDARFSYMAALARGLPQNRGSGEDIARLSADLVLIGPYDSRATREMLRRQGLAVLELGPWTSLDDGRAQIRTLASRLGHPERGEALVAGIDEALGRARAAPRTGRSVLLFERRGYVPASGGLTVSILKAAGFADAAPGLGLSEGGFVSLEALLRAGPDFLVVSDGDDSAEDQGSALLVHPAMAARYPASKRITIPDRLTICGGPSVPELVETVLAAAAKVAR